MDTPIEKLKQYRTAYSVLDECYVEIVRVWPDENGKPLLRCRLQDTDKEFLFRESELNQFCL